MIGMTEIPGMIGMFWVTNGWDGWDDQDFWDGWDDMDDRHDCNNWDDRMTLITRLIGI